MYDFSETPNDTISDLKKLVHKTLISVLSSGIIIRLEQKKTHTHTRRFKKPFIVRLESKNCSKIVLSELYILLLYFYSY